jgi:hypothetical protein
MVQPVLTVQETDLPEQMTDYVTDSWLQASYSRARHSL